MSEPKRLRRELGLLDAVGVGVGAIIGAGIFVVIGVAAGVAGSSLILGLVLAAVVALCNALSSAELAVRYPRSGGTYEYGYELVHPLAGFSAGWLFMASKLAAGGTVALGFGSYLATWFPSVEVRVGAVGAVVALTAANLSGIRKAGKLNLAIIAVTVSSLIAFVMSGAAHVNPAYFSLEGESVLAAAALMFFSFTGYARIATLAEEVHEPERTIPRAIMISLAIATALYVLVAVVAVGSVGAPELASSKAPLIGAALSFSGANLSNVLTIGATTAMLGVLLSQILGISRVQLAMARRGDLPKVLSRVGERQAVPVTAILTTGSIIAVLAWFGSLKQVASAASFTILLYYTITNIASLRLSSENKRFPRFVSWLGLLSCLALAVSLDQQVMAIGLAVLGAGLLWRLAYRAVARST